MKNQFLFGAIAFGAMTFASVAISNQAQAFSLEFGAGSQSSNDPATGASATVDFTFSDDNGDVLVNLLISNTTGDSIFGSGATTSKLTGIGLDLVGGTYIGSSFNGPGALDTVLFDAELQPFGTFDIAFTDNNNFLGGNPSGALPQGQSSAVSFLLDSDFDAATVESLFATAFNTDGSARAVARFQVVNAGAGSDKLLYVCENSADCDPIDDPNPVPTPAAVLPILGGLFGAASRRKKSESTEA